MKDTLPTVKIVSSPIWEMWGYNTIIYCFKALSGRFSLWGTPNSDAIGMTMSWAHWSLNQDNWTPWLVRWYYSQLIYLARCRPFEAFISQWAGRSDEQMLTMGVQLMWMVVTIAQIQSSAVITLSNLSWYYIRHGDNCGRKWIKY